MFFRAGKISGGVLIIGAVLGVIFAVIGLFLVWSGQLSLTTRLTRGMDLLDRTLQTSSDGLVLISSSLKTSQDTIKVIRATSKELSTTAGGTAPMLDQMGQTIGQDMSGVVHNTQNSLASAQSSAKLVDDTLAVISSLPLIGQRYSPKQSLGDSIGSINASLDGLPNAFQQIQAGLKTTSGNLLAIQKEMDTVQTNIDAADVSIQNAQQIVEQYQGQVNELQTQVRDFRSGLPGWILATKWSFTVLFIWMAFEQLALLVQGLEWYRLEREP